MSRPLSQCLLAGLLGFTFAYQLPSAAAAEKIKIGLLPISGSAPVFIAQEKGYFAAEGLDAQLVNFDAGQPTAVATVSGDIDFGDAGLSAALYALCGEGTLRIIGGGTQDRPGFHADSALASNAAYKAGLTSLAKLGDHSAGLTQIGGTYHYVLGLLAAKYGIDLKTVRPLPLQSLSNVAAAVSGGQADFALLTGNFVPPLVDKGDAKLLAWVGDVVTWQVSAVWTSTKVANERHDTVERFLRALRKGSRDYYDAFTDQNGRPAEGKTAPEVLQIIAKYTKQPIDQLKLSLAYVDPDNRLDTADIERQIDWYRSQGMLKQPVDIHQVIDTRYASTTP